MIEYTDIEKMTGYRELMKSKRLPGGKIELTFLSGDPEWAFQRWLRTGRRGDLGGYSYVTTPERAVRLLAQRIGINVLL